MTPLGLSILVSLCALATTEIGQSKGEPGSFNGPICGTRPAITDALGQMYGEAQQDWRLVDKDSIKELWGNPDTGSWSVLRTYTVGSACLIRSGNAGPWRDL